jgi:heat shock protein HspQ
MLAQLPSVRLEVLALATLAPYFTPMTHVLHGMNRPHPEGAPAISSATFAIGEVVKHRVFDFRGVIFDVDPAFANSEEWYQSIPAEVRPRKDQPFYHLLAENGEGSYVAYVSQQNLLADEENGPVSHPAIAGIFDSVGEGRYALKTVHKH